MKLKSWLTFAGILNIIVGFLILNISSVSLVPAIFLILGGFYIKNYFDNSESVKKNKEILLILGILNLFVNFISGIITLEVYGQIKKQKIDIVNENQNKNKRIDVLLQLGVILIIISGLMIATSNSINLSDIFKVVGLGLLTIIFFGLAVFSRKYLKLESSFSAYYLLGVTFIIVDFIALNYYNLLGVIDLYFYPVLYTLIGTLALNIKQVLKKEFITEISVVSFLLAVFTLFKVLDLNIVINLLVMTIILSLMNILKNTSNSFTAAMEKAGYYLSLIIVPINIGYLIFESFNIYSLILSLVSVLNLFYIHIKNRDNISAVFAPLTLLVMSSIVIGRSSLDLDVSIIIISVMLSVFYILIKLINFEDNIVFKYTYKIVFNLSFIVISIISFFANELSSMIVTSILLFTNILMILKDKEDRVELYIEPAKSLMFAISLVIYLNSLVNIDIILNLLIVSILELVLYYILNNKLLKNIHYILFLIIIGLTSIVGAVKDDILLVTMAQIASLIPFIIVELENRKDYLPSLICSGTFTLIISTNNIFSDYYYFNYIVLFPVLVLLAYINKINKVKKNTFLIISALLLLSLLDNIVVSYDLYKCLNLLTYTYLGLIISFNINNKNAKDIFFMIYSLLIVLTSFVDGGLLTGLAIGTVTLLMVIIGSLKDFKKVKITGIILFILNLIYQLKDWWDRIPLAIYLLIAGFVLIGIVIVKEIKENK